MGNPAAPEPPCPEWDAIASNVPKWDTMGCWAVSSESRKLRGDGRAAFVRALPAIRREIAGGEYLTVIYARRAAMLGITYSAFRKLVARHAQDAKPVARRPYGSGKSAQAPAPALSPTAPPRPAATPARSMGDVPRPVYGGSDARHEHPRAHAVPRTFSYDGNPSADDEALIRPASRDA